MEHRDDRSGSIHRQQFLSLIHRMHLCGSSPPLPNPSPHEFKKLRVIPSISDVFSTNIELNLFKNKQAQFVHKSKLKKKYIKLFQFYYEAKKN